MISDFVSEKSVFSDKFFIFVRRIKQKSRLMIASSFMMIIQFGRAIYSGSTLSAVAVLCIGFAAFIVKDISVEKMSYIIVSISFFFRLNFSVLMFILRFFNCSARVIIFTLISVIRTSSNVMRSFSVLINISKLSLIIGVISVSIINVMLMAMLIFIDMSR